MAPRAYNCLRLKLHLFFCAFLPACELITSWEFDPPAAVGRNDLAFRFGRAGLGGFLEKVVQALFELPSGRVIPGDGLSEAKSHNP